MITPTGIDRKYYEFCVLNELKGALRSGDTWVKGSRRYRNFDDYLIPSDDFEKSLRDNQLPLAVPADCHEYIKSRLTLLASRLEEVNAMALAGDLPDVDISDKGVKITPLDNSVPSAASPLAIWFMACSLTLKGGRLENGKYPTLSLFFELAWRAAMSEV